MLGSLVLEYIDYSAEGEDIAAQIGLLDANGRDNPVVVRMIQYANRLREQVVGLQRYNGQLNKTVTSYENQMREYQVSDAGNILAASCQSSRGSWTSEDRVRSLWGCWAASPEPPWTPGRVSPSLWRLQ